MPYVDLDTGVLHLHSEITYGNAVEFLTTLRHMDGLDTNDCLTIHIMCHGGDLMPSVAIAQALRTCRKPVNTVGVGYVASGAVLVLAAGTPGRRQVIEGTRIVVHEPSTSMAPVSRKSPGIAMWENEVAFTKDAFSCVYDLMGRFSKHPARFWQEMVENKPDRLLMAQEALELGLIDIIVSLGT